MWWRTDFATYAPFRAPADDGGAKAAATAEASDADADATDDGGKPDAENILDLADKPKPKADDGDNRTKDADADEDGRHLADPDADADADADKKADDDEDKQPTKLTFKERPDWLPANFWNKDTGEVDVEALAKSQRDLRAQISKGLDKVPAEAKDYKFEAPEHLRHIEEIMDARLDDADAEDPVIAWFKNAAHKNGINQATAQSLYEGFLETVGEIIPQLPDPRVEMKRLGNNATTIVNHLAEFRQTLLDSGTFSPDEAAAMSRWMVTATDIQAFQKIREWYGEHAIPFRAQPAEGARGRAELRAAMGEVLKKANSGDPSAQAEYDKLQVEYQKTFGTEPAGTSLAG